MPEYGRNERILAADEFASIRRYTAVQILMNLSNGLIQVRNGPRNRVKMAPLCTQPFVVNLLRRRWLRGEKRPDSKTEGPV